jgi:hypothetical protein
MNLSTTGPTFLERALINLKRAFEAKDMVGFTSEVKSIAKSEDAPNAGDAIRKYFTRKSINAMTNETIGDNIWSVGRLGLSFTSQSSNQKDVCIELLKKFVSLKGLGSLAITKSFVGFSASKLKWEYLPYELQSEMFERLIEICPELNSMELVALLESLATMELKWEQLPQDLQFGFIARMALAEENFQHKTASLIFKSLYDLRFWISDKNKNMDEAEVLLVSTLCNLAIKVFNSQENTFHDPYYLPRLTGLLNGLGGIGLKVKRMPPELRKELTDFIETKFRYLNVEIMAKFVLK